MLVHHVGIGEVEIVGVGDEVEEQRVAVDADRQQVGGVTVEQVGEEVDVQRALRPRALEVGEAGTLVDVERADAGVHDAVRGGITGGQRDQLLAVGEGLVVAQVDLLLLGALILERRIRRRRIRARDIAGRAIVRILLTVAGGDLEAPVVAADGVGDAAVEAAEVTAAEVDRGADHFPRRLGDQVDDAAQRVGAPDRGARTTHDLDLRDLAEVDRQQVPHNEAEEVEVDAATIEQHELAGRQAGRGATAGDLHVAGADLRNIQTRHVAQDVAIVVGRGILELRGGDHGHRHRHFLETLLGARSGHHDDFFDRVFDFRFFVARVLCPNDRSRHQDGQRQHEH